MMNSRILQKTTKTHPIELTDQILKHFFNNIFKQSISELTKRTGLPYMLIYNIVNRRVKSISARHYRIIFGEEPPLQEPKKVDGTFFRKIVDLWLFLNNDITKSDIYREFYGRKHPKKVDYRIFTGQTETVEYRLEKIMGGKFSDCGLDQWTVKQWIQEFNMLEHGSRIPYGQIRPLLLFLKNALGVHPTSILNQLFDRYETGELKSVSCKVYDRACDLKKRAERALDSGRWFEIEKIKEEIYGKKAGYTLYSEVEDELKFLQKYAKKSPKKYLGRGTSIYERGKCKRIASWRVAKIMDDCDTFIRQRPELPLWSLPRSRRKKWIRGLLNVLVSRAMDMFFQDEGNVLEKQILTPAYSRDEYKKPTHGFIQFDMASNALGMKKKAFDLMVAKNCEIFRWIGRFDKRWYLSDLYLKELSEKEFFDLITVKYELMAKELNRSKQIDECMH